jgi:hypothetical protein
MDMHKHMTRDDDTEQRALAPHTMSEFAARRDCDGWLPTRWRPRTPECVGGLKCVCFGLVLCRLDLCVLCVLRGTVCACGWWGHRRTLSTPWQTQAAGVAHPGTGPSTLHAPTPPPSVRVLLHWMVMPVLLLPR